ILSASAVASGRNGPHGNTLATGWFPRRAFQRSVIDERGLRGRVGHIPPFPRASLQKGGTTPHCRPRERDACAACILHVGPVESLFPQPIHSTENVITSKHGWLFPSHGRVTCRALRCRSDAQPCARPNFKLTRSHSTANIDQYPW